MPKFKCGILRVKSSEFFALGEKKWNLSKICSRSAFWAVSRVDAIRELEREQWNSRFTKYGFEGN